MMGTRRKDKTETRERKPRMAVHVRGTMSFLEGNNFNSNRKGSQPLQETFALRGFTKALTLREIMDRAIMR